MIFSNRLLVRGAKIISSIFSPFHLPFLAFGVLMFFSYLNYMPWTYNLLILSIVYLFSVLLPRLGIFLYRKMNGWNRQQIARKERRYVPFFLSILSYIALLLLMQHLRLPRFMQSVVLCALLLQGICMVLNAWMKISMHAAASGALIGLLLAFSFLFRFDPTGWLCLCVFQTGLVGSARVLLRLHTSAEVGIGVLVGVVCGFFSILLL